MAVSPQSAFTITNVSTEHVKRFHYFKTTYTLKFQVGSDQPNVSEQLRQTLDKFRTVMIKPEHEDWSYRICFTAPTFTHTVSTKPLRGYGYTSDVTISMIKAVEQSVADLKAGDELLCHVQCVPATSEQRAEQTRINKDEQKTLSNEQASVIIDRNRGEAEAWLAARQAAREAHRIGAAKGGVASGIMRRKLKAGRISAAAAGAAVAAAAVANEENHEQHRKRRNEEALTATQLAARDAQKKGAAKGGVASGITRRRLKAERIAVAAVATAAAAAANKDNPEQHRKRRNKEALTATQLAARDAQKIGAAKGGVASGITRRRLKAERVVVAAAGAAAAAAANKDNPVQHRKRRNKEALTATQLAARDAQKIGAAKGGVASGITRRRLKAERVAAAAAAANKDNPEQHRKRRNKEALTATQLAARDAQKIGAAKGGVASGITRRRLKAERVAAAAAAAAS